MLLGAWSGGVCSAVVRAVAGVERLNRAVGIVERVGPHARCGHRVAAVAVVAGGPGGDRREGELRSADVGTPDPAARGRPPWPAIVDAAGLGDAAARGAGNDRGVVGAVVVFFLMEPAPPEFYPLPLHDPLPIGVERLTRAVEIVERVGPPPRCGHRVAAVAVVAGGPGGDRREG